MKGYTKNYRYNKLEVLKSGVFYRENIDKYIVRVKGCDGKTRTMCGFHDEDKAKKEYKRLSQNIQRLLKDKQ